MLVRTPQQRSRNEDGAANVGVVAVNKLPPAFQSALPLRTQELHNCNQVSELIHSPIPPKKTSTRKLKPEDSTPRFSHRISEGLAARLMRTWGENHGARKPSPALVVLFNFVCWFLKTFVLVFKNPLLLVFKNPGSLLTRGSQNNVNSSSQVARSIASACQGTQFEL